MTDIYVPNSPRSVTESYWGEEVVPARKYVHTCSYVCLSEGLPECWFGGVGVKLFESMYVRMYVGLSVFVGGST